MEKRNVIEGGRTPELDDKPGEKSAESREACPLEDDLLKKASEKVKGKEIVKKKSNNC